MSDSIYTAFGKAKLGEIGFMVARGWGSEEVINHRESTGNFWKDGNVLYINYRDGYMP